MTDEQIKQLIIDAIGYAKLTTIGYASRPVSYWSNTTTNWYKSLSRLNQAIAELKKRHVGALVVISLSGTPQVGQVLTAKVSVT